MKSHKLKAQFTLADCRYDFFLRNFKAFRNNVGVVRQK